MEGFGFFFMPEQLKCCEYAYLVIEFVAVGAECQRCKLVPIVFLSLIMHVGSSGNSGVPRKVFLCSVFSR